MAQPYFILPAQGDNQIKEWLELGQEAHVNGKFDKAQHYYQRALRLDPSHAFAIHNLAILFAQQGNITEALLAIERAVIFDPRTVMIYANWAFLNFEADRIADALAIAKRGIELAGPPPNGTTDEIHKAGYLQARLAYAMVSSTAGSPDETLKAYNEMLAVDPAHPAASANACFAQSLIALGPKELLEQRMKWHSAHAWKKKHWGHTNDRDPDRPLRVGYVGGDFKQHSAAMMFSQVIFNHDRANYQPYLYCTLPTDPEKDHISEKFTRSGEWRDIQTKSDDEVETMIADDKIDILVDLAAHTNGGRVALFTRRPAPVQVTAWGFAHGTGCPEVDYFFADPVAIPEMERQHYAEKIIDVPCIVTYRPPEEYQLKPAGTPPYFRNDFVTFGSFSRFEKLSDGCLECFRRILEAVPDSRLYLKDHSYRRPYSIRRVLDRLPGVDPKRVKFGTATTHPEHLAEYQTVDLCLDPHPHGGGVVSLETLYAGVPMITKYGTQPAGRTASSVLTLMGRTEWIARTDEEYVAKAVEWAGRPADLSKARKVLRDELVSSPVVKGYPQAIEATYRTIWRKWCEK